MVTKLICIPWEKKANGQRHELQELLDKFHNSPDAQVYSFCWGMDQVLSRALVECLTSYQDDIKRQIYDTNEQLWK